jgi:hypothetical protein
VPLPVRLDSGLVGLRLVSNVLLPVGISAASGFVAPPRLANVLPLPNALLCKFY